MASIILGTIAKSVGVAVGGPLGGVIASQVGQLVGGSIDNRVSGNSARRTEGARLEDLAVQTSTYGRVIASIYGSARIAGNVIWARPIKELATTTTTRTGKGGKKPAASSQTNYSYYSTLAVAVCAGTIERVDRIWADAKLLNASQYTMRIYYGTQTQLPDTLIESYQGNGRTPAYRGLAYVVFEDFPLAEFGNRVPNFTFEVSRNKVDGTSDNSSAESLVTSLMLIPGSGEVVYDTNVQSKVDGELVGGRWIQKGNRVAMNLHNTQDTANVNLALNHMQQTFPNLEWVGVVVNWFGSSLDAANCIVEPCVEYGTSARTEPDEWSVAGRTRSTARVIGYENNAPRYGGTPSDAGILRLVTALRARGLKIMFYPMMLMDVTGKPWRGTLTGSASAAASFFTKTNGYNSFILHYANLLKGKIDGFAIGTEMRDLTKVTSGAGVYPAVTQFVSLASTVKGILGASVKITYAADWSEYHHTDNGWYHMDPLWASSAIDVIGIDAYFPLTDAPQTRYDKQAIKDGWVSGEGYDWYYSDVARTTKQSLAPAFAWKNIAWWWNNTHTNPNGVTTAWVPQSKKIWFTEYGFASVDGATNEPNVFVDSSTSQSRYPRFSRARVDFAIQRLAIEATEEVWKNSAMVERKFLWAWDARPYPQWPDLTSVWSDGAVWVSGHWVQGKIGNATLASVVRQLLLKAGLSSTQIDVTDLHAYVDGYVIYQRQTIRAALEELMRAYRFDLIESEEKIKAISRGNAVAISIDAGVCLPVTEDEQRVPYSLSRQQEVELPKEVEILYLNRLNGYNSGVQRASRETGQAISKLSSRFSLVLSDQHARVIAQSQLNEAWLSRTSYQLQLPMQYAALEPSDVIELMDNDTKYTMRIESIDAGKPGLLKITAVAEDPSSYDVVLSPVIALLPTGAVNLVADTQFEVLDLPALPQDALDEAKLRFGASGTSANWPGCAIYEIKTQGDELLVSIEESATLGATTNVLGNALAQRIDEASSVDVVLYGEKTLASITQEALLAGGNAALIGNEIIQFRNAATLGASKYRLSGLLRGRLGTEDRISEHQLGERFVLLDTAIKGYNLLPEERTMTLQITGVTIGNSINPQAILSVEPQLRSLKPYSPVHIRGLRNFNADITISWIRRTRFNGGLQNYQDVPLSEVDERYDVEIVSGTQVIRTLRVTSANYVYLAAQQITDFGAIQNQISVRIYQLSTLAGRGIAGIATV